MIFEELQSSVSAPVELVCTSLHLQDFFFQSWVLQWSYNCKDLPITPILRSYSSVNFGSTPRGPGFPHVLAGAVSIWEEFVKQRFIPIVDLSVTLLNRETIRPVESIVIFNDSTDKQLESHFKTLVSLVDPAFWRIKVTTRKGHAVAEWTTSFKRDHSPAAVDPFLTVFRSDIRGPYASAVLAR